MTKKLCLPYGKDFKKSKQHSTVNQPDGATYIHHPKGEQTTNGEQGGQESQGRMMSPHSLALLLLISNSQFHTKIKAYEHRHAQRQIYHLFMAALFNFCILWYIIWANTNITDAELGLTGYVMFRRDRIGRRGGGVILYVKESIQAYEITLEREADYDEAVWCEIGNSKLTIGLVYRSPNINEEDNTKCYKLKKLVKGNVS